MRGSDAGDGGSAPTDRWLPRRVNRSLSQHSNNIEFEVEPFLSLSTSLVPQCISSQSPPGSVIRTVIVKPLNFVSMEVADAL
jgi:hypothetical protein